MQDPYRGAQHIPPGNSNTNYKRVSELGYTPSENEFRQRVTYLAVLTVYDEGTILEEKASEYYYIDD